MTPCPKISRRKLSQIATKLRNSRRFSLSKVSRYTVDDALYFLTPIYNMPCSVLQISWTFVQSFRDGLVFPQVVLTRLAVINTCVCAST